MPEKQKPQQSETDESHGAQPDGASDATKIPDSKTRTSVRRESDKRPNPEGPQYEEGGQYPGTRSPDR